MTIEDLLDFIEEDLLKGAVIKCARDSPKDFLAFYSSTKEFVRAKIQRQAYEPLSNEEVKIIIEDAPPESLPLETLERLITKIKDENENG